MTFKSFFLLCLEISCLFNAWIFNKKKFLFILADTNMIIQIINSIKRRTPVVSLDPLEKKNVCRSKTLFKRNFFNYISRKMKILKPIQSVVNWLENLRSCTKLCALKRSEYQDGWCFKCFIMLRTSNLRIRSVVLCFSCCFFFDLIYAIVELVHPFYGFCFERRMYNKTKIKLSVKRLHFIFSNSLHFFFSSIDHYFL